MKTRISFVLWLCRAVVLLFVVTGSQPSSAQEIEGAEAFYIYQNDGHFDGFFYDEVKEIRYSCFDTLGIERSEYVSQEIVTADSVYRIMLTAIDSVSFVQPEIKYAESVRFMRDEGLTDYYISLSKHDDDSFLLLFSGSMPLVLQPKVGDVLVCPDLKDYDEAFVGKVKKVRTEDNKFVVECGYIDDLKDVFEQFITVEQVRKVPTAEGPKVRRRMAGLNVPRKVEGNLDNITLFSFNTVLEGNLLLDEDLRLGVALNVGFGMTCSAVYKINWSEFYLKVLLKDQASLGASLSLDGSVSDNFDLDKLPGLGAFIEKFSKIPFPAALPILYANMVPKPFARVEAHIKASLNIGGMVQGNSFMLEIKDKWPYVDMGVNPIAPFLPYTLEKEKTFSASIQVNGMFQVGMKFPIEVGTNGWIKNVCSLKTGATVYAGPKASGALDFNFLKRKDGVYEAMKESKVDLSLMSIDTELSAEGSLWGKKTEKKTTYNWTYGNWPLTLFPNINPMRSEVTGEDKRDVKVSYSVSGDVFLPQMLGVGIFQPKDENDKQFKKLYKYDYRYELYFLNTFNSVDIMFEDLEPGTYKVRPTIVPSSNFNPSIPDQPLFQYDDPIQVTSLEQEITILPNGLSLDPEEFTAEEDGGLYYIEILTNLDNPITCEPSDKWIKADVEVRPKSKILKVTIDENDTDAFRKGSILVRQVLNEVEFAEKTLNIGQYGGLQLSKSTVEFQIGGGNVTLDILTSGDPIKIDLNGAEDWLSYNLDGRKLSITAKENEGATRSTVIIVSAWSKRKNQFIEFKLIVKQKGLVEASLEPVQLFYEPDGGTQRVNVTHGSTTKLTEVKVRDNSNNWLTIEKANDHFNVTAMPHTGEEQRTAYVDATFTRKGDDGKDYTATLSVAIYQEGVPDDGTPKELPDSIVFGRERYSRDFNITVNNATIDDVKVRATNLDWNGIGSSQWLSVKMKEKIDDHNAIITITVAPNYMQQIRTGTIQVCGNNFVGIPVYQSAKVTQTLKPQELNLKEMGIYISGDTGDDRSVMRAHGNASGIVIPGGTKGVIRGVCYDYENDSWEDIIKDKTTVKDVLKYPKESDHRTRMEYEFTIGSDDDGYYIEDGHIIYHQNEYLIYDTEDKDGITYNYYYSYLRDFDMHFDKTRFNRVYFTEPDPRPGNYSHLAFDNCFVGYKRLYYYSDDGIVDETDSNYTFSVHLQTIFDRDDYPKQ